MKTRNDQVFQGTKKQEELQQHATLVDDYVELRRSLEQPFQDDYQESNQTKDEEFKERKKNNPDIAYPLHVLQKSGVEVMKKHLDVPGNWIEGEISFKVLEKLHSDNREDQKEALDEILREYMSLDITKESIDMKYLATHGKAVTRIINTGKALLEMMDNEDYKWYFTSIPSEVYTPFCAMLDLVEAYSKYIEDLMLSHGMNPDFEELLGTHDLDAPYAEDEQKAQEIKAKAKKSLSSDEKKFDFMIKNLGRAKKLADTKRKKDTPKIKDNKKKQETIKRMDYNREVTSLSSEEREELRHKDTYKIKKVSAEQSAKKKADVKKKQHINDVEGALSKVMGETYKKMRDAVLDTDSEEEEVELVHSMGTQLLEQGHDVLEFDVGGSGYSEFRRDYDGVHGKHKEDERALVDRFGERVSDKYKYIRSKKTEKDVEVDGELKHRTKTRFSMSGPMPTEKAGGLLNVGDYSIEKTRTRIRDYGAEYLTPIFKGWEDQIKNNTTPDWHDIDIMMRGHSRGGVGVAQGAMMLKRWVHDNYPHFEMFVKFHMIQMDPVPGGDVEAITKLKDEQYEKFDYEEYQNVHGGDFVINGEKMRSLGREASSTVVYSMNLQSDLTHEKLNLFKPQEVLHAKRMVLMPFNHDVGMGMDFVDETQKSAGEKEKSHGMAFYDATSKKVYRNTGLDALGDGVYVMDENQIMVRVDSMEQLKAILALTMPEDRQKERQARILRAAASILGEQFSVDDYAPINHSRTMALSNKIKKGIGVFASSYRKDIGKAMDAVQKALKKKPAALPDGRLDVSEIEKTYNAAIKACAVYVENRSGDKMTDSGDERLDEIKKLFANLQKDLDFIKSEARKQVTGRNAANWDEVFDVVSEIDVSVSQELPGGILRIEKPSGVSFIEKSTKESEKKHGPAAGVAFTSRFSEVFAGGKGLYQGAQLAKLHDGDEESEGLALEQMPPLTLTQLKSEAKSIKLTSEALLKGETITAMNVVLGIPFNQKEFENNLHVIYTMNPKTKSAVIKDVIAPATSTAFATKGTAELTANEKAIIKKLSSGAKDVIRKLEADPERIKKWGLIPPDKVDMLIKRIDNLKKLVK